MPEPGPSRRWQVPTRPPELWARAGRKVPRDCWSRGPEPDGDRFRSACWSPGSECRGDRFELAGWCCGSEPDGRVPGGGLAVPWATRSFRSSGGLRRGVVLDSAWWRPYTGALSERLSAERPGDIAPFDVQGHGLASRRHARQLGTRASGPAQGAFGRRGGRAAADPVSGGVGRVSAAASGQRRRRRREGRRMGAGSSGTDRRPAGGEEPSGLGGPANLADHRAAGQSPPELGLAESR